MTTEKPYRYAISTGEGSAMFRWHDGDSLAACWWMGSPIWFPPEAKLQDIIDGIADGQFREATEDEARKLYPIAFSQ